jgi:transcription initiation factor IIE alpha subunit
MKKEIKCEKCGEVLGWYDHNERFVNIYDKDAKVEYVGRKMIATVKCCDTIQNIELK